MIQLQVRLRETPSRIVTPGNLQSGEMDCALEVLALNATKPETDVARKLADKIAFWMNKATPHS